MKIKQTLFFFLAIVFAGLLAACSNDAQEDQHTTMNHEGTEEAEHMEHSSSGELPDGLEKAANPKFEAGSQAVMNTDHMEGMDGAEATIAGAFDTTVYAISYTPENGGERVENHKWVVHEEIRNAEDKPYQPGDEVTIEADHMEGMEGASAIIDTAEQTTVYMVDYTSTTDDEKVENHKWVTESELSAK